MATLAKHGLLLLVWLALTAAGCTLGVHLALERERVAFEASVQAEHRWLSQQARQHEVLLETLALLQPAPGTSSPAASFFPEARLPGLHPTLQKVLRQDASSAWPTALASRLSAAQAQSQQTGRTVMAHVELTAGRYLLVRAAQPASFALQVDLRALTPDGDDPPLALHGQVRAWLEYGGDRRVLAPGASGADDPGGWRYGFRQRLASDTLPVDLVAVRRVGWSSLPWVSLAAWCLATSLLALAVFAQWRRRAQPEPMHPATLTLDELSALSFESMSRVDRDWLGGAVHGRRGSGGHAPLVVTLREIDKEPPALVVARGAINQAARQSRRTSEVISRLRSAAAETAEAGVREQAVPVADLLRDALELAEPESGSLRVLTRLAVEEPAGSVWADPVALEQIVHTLLRNALHAAAQSEGDDRRVDVSCANLDGQVVVSIRDNGRGIPPELLPRLFGPFFNSRSDGLGQGLSHCDTLARSMGGSLSAANVVPQGAVFRLLLPRHFR